jgi:hypothetical protein
MWEKEELGLVFEFLSFLSTIFITTPLTHS